MCDSQTIKNIEPTKLDTANLEFEVCEHDSILSIEYTLLFCQFLSDLSKDTLNCTLCKLAFESIKRALAKNVSEVDLTDSLTIEYNYQYTSLLYPTNH